MGDGDTLVNALVGGIAAVVLSFVPFSPVLGGAVAGYLQGGTRNDGLWVGVYAGVVAGIPIVLGGVGFLLLWGFMLLGYGTPGAGGGLAVFLVFALGGLVVGALYTVGLSALGGWLGNYVRYDTDLLD